MSDQDSNIFKETLVPTEPVIPSASGTPPNDTAYADLLASIRNEQGQPKYRDIPTALAALNASQNFIETLKAEKAEAERKFQEATGNLTEQEELKRTVAELIRKQNEDRPTGQPSLTPEKIAEMVNQTLSQREVQATAKQNTSQVVTALKAAYGDQAESKYNAAAEEMGLSVADFNALAAKSPKAVLKALGVGVQSANQPNSFAPAKSYINTSAFKPNQESFVKRNSEPSKIGATHQDLIVETRRSKAMVDELEAAGLSVHELSDPKLFSKYFS